MRAVYIDEFGSADNLSLRDVPQPAEPIGRDVLVRVYAAGLNRADLLQIRGAYPPPPGISPNIPGLEFAGEIVAVGAEVTDRKVGNRVFGIAAGEAQAEFLISDERLLAPIPAELSFTEAAAVPEAFITAQDAIFTLGKLRSGGTLLIHAVGSGVGLAGLQLAKAYGCRVIGTSRTQSKLDRCVELGLDDGICTGDAIDFAAKIQEITGGRGADVILDLVGAAFLDQNLKSLALKGRLILVGLTSGRTAELDLGMALRKRARIIGTVLRSRSIEERSDATKRFSADVVPLIESGAIRPFLDKAYPAAAVIDAYKYLESNESFGKVVLEF